jgi:hypothetical protein
MGKFGFCRKNRNPDIPIAKATGIPMRSRRRKTHATNSILENPFSDRATLFTRRFQPAGFHPGTFRRLWFAFYAVDLLWVRARLIRKTVVSNRKVAPTGTLRVTQV